MWKCSSGAWSAHTPWLANPVLLLLPTGPVQSSWWVARSVTQLWPLLRPPGYNMPRCLVLCSSTQPGKGQRSLHPAPPDFGGHSEHGDCDFKSTKGRRVAGVPRRSLSHPVWGFSGARESSTTLTLVPSYFALKNEKRIRSGRRKGRARHRSFIFKSPFGRVETAVPLPACKAERFCILH